MQPTPEPARARKLLVLLSHVANMSFGQAGTEQMGTVGCGAYVPLSCVGGPGLFLRAHCSRTTDELSTCGQVAGCFLLRGLGPGVLGEAG